MSANNWTQCPKCAVTRDRAAEEARRKLSSAYGKVPAEQFMQMQSDMAAKEEEKPEPTMREDYDIWTDEHGQFFVDYRCSCGACNFYWRYKNAVSVLQ